LIAYGSNYQTTVENTATIAYDDSHETSLTIHDTYEVYLFAMNKQEVNS
jgi:hypothetical protein